MHYVVVIEKTKQGYSAYVPDLPGCISVGNSREQIEQNIQEAILFHVEGIHEDGDRLPVPNTEAVTMLIPSVG